MTHLIKHSHFRVDEHKGHFRVDEHKALLPWCISNKPTHLLEQRNAVFLYLVVMECLDTIEDPAF